MTLFKISQEGMKQEFTLKKNKLIYRTWAEVNFDKIGRNVDKIRKVIPKSCGIMAVVKANAYGHGGWQVARYLNKIGVSAFAVATLEEAIDLRENHVTGDILILGYTPIEDMRLVRRYNLTQSIFSLEYAKQINSHGFMVRGHIKVDTGMNRLGEQSIRNIINIYALINLKIEGIYSHLAASDSQRQEDINYTLLQIEKFKYVIEYLKGMGIKTGKTHIQSSYGILNYPQTGFDYVRPGILLYGLLSNDGDKTGIKINLEPALTIKSKVSLIKKVDFGSEIGYSRSYQAIKSMNIAIISMGYGDGLPRNLSKGYVLIHGQKAPIIGKICMDSFTVDVSHIPNVIQSDEVIIIGEDKGESIKASSIANRCNTITNEILTGFSPRVAFKYIDTSFSEVV